MKNDIFNFSRFGKYFASDIRTCRSNFGLSLLTIALLFPVATYFITTVFNFVINSVWDGPDMGLRVFVFVVALLCMIITMPVKCYGRITEKQYGSSWLMLPASRLEKRMGKGKGAPDHWVAVVKPGTILFELEGATMEDTQKAMRLASDKLPIKTKLVARR